MSASTETPRQTSVNGAALRTPVDWKFPVVYSALALVTLLLFGLFEIGRASCRERV